MPKDGDNNPATNPEAWDPEVVHEAVSGLIPAFEEKLRLLSLFKQDVPPSIGTTAIDAATTSAAAEEMAAAQKQKEEEEKKKSATAAAVPQMKATGYYDEQGHWWRMFHEPYSTDTHGEALTEATLRAAILADTGSQIEEHMRSEMDTTHIDGADDKITEALLSVAEDSVLSVCARKDVLTAVRDSALGLNGPPSRAILRENKRQAPSVDSVSVSTDADADADPDADMMMQEEQEEQEEAERVPFKPLLHYRLTHPGPSLVDLAAPGRGAVILSPPPNTLSFSALQQQQRRYYHSASQTTLVSPPFVARFANPFASPVLGANLSDSEAALTASVLAAPGVSTLSQLSLPSAILSVFDYSGTGAPSSAPTAVQQNLRNRNNRYGFRSIMRQMLQLVSFGKSDLRSRTGNEEEESSTQMLANTIFSGSLLFSHCRPWLEAPLLNKVAAVVKAAQVWLGLQHPGADPSVLAWTSSAVERPVGYSFSGSEGRVTVVLPKARLLRRVAIQYALPPQRQAAAGNGDHDHGAMRGLAFRCGAPTRLRLLAGCTT